MDGKTFSQVKRLTSWGTEGRSSTVGLSPKPELLRPAVDGPSQLLCLGLDCGST